MNMQTLGFVAVVLAVALGLKVASDGTGDTSAVAHQKVQAGAVLVDVRSVEEFGAGHLQGAINVPVQDLPARIAAIGDKNRPVVLYCRSGARSARAARILKEHGYSDVTDLGSMENW